MSILILYAVIHDNEDQNSIGISPANPFAASSICSFSLGYGLPTEDNSFSSSLTSNSGLRSFGS